MSQNPQEGGDNSSEHNEEDRYLNTFLKVKYAKADENSVKPTTALQKIKRYRNQENSQYYFTIGRKETTFIRDVVKEKTPFGHPLILKEESFKAYSKAKNKEIRKEEKKLRYFERDSFKSRETKDIRARVYVEEPPDDVHTVVDLDPEFYSLIEGRPIEYPFDKTNYMNDVRETTLFKLQAGYREDEVLRIEENFTDEEEKYKEICQRYNDYVDSFEQFLSEDYKKSIAMLNESEELANTLQKKNDEFKHLSVELGIKRRRVYVLEEKIRQTKMFQEFLYTISPRIWCDQHGIIRHSKDSRVALEDSVKDLSKPPSEGMFAKYQLESLDGTIPSLMHLINCFKEDQVDARPPLLFFTEPKQLFKIFRRIVMQNLKSWTHAEKLSENLAKLREGLLMVKGRIHQEQEEVEDIIHDLNSEIEKEEHRVLMLKEKVNKIVHTHFYDAVASEYAMRFYLCVKDVYEKLIVSTVTFSTFQMLKTLQTEYESIIMQLDALDPEVVNEVKRETFVKDRIAMQLAEKASIELKNLEKVHRRLRKDFEPPFVKIGKPVMFRSTFKTYKAAKKDEFAL